MLYNDGGYNRKRALTLNIFLSTKTKAKHQLQIKPQIHLTKIHKALDKPLFLKFPVGKLLLKIITPVQQLKPP